jgi:amidase
MLPGVKGSLNSFLDLPEILLPHAISGPLFGYTFAVKDIFDIAGYKTGAGNPDIYQESEVKSKNAHVVQKLLGKLMSKRCRGFIGNHCPPKTSGP